MVIACLSRSTASCAARAADHSDHDSTLLLRALSKLVAPLFRCWCLERPRPSLSRLHGLLCRLQCEVAVKIRRHVLKAALLANVGK